MLLVVKAPIILDQTWLGELSVCSTSLKRIVKVDVNWELEKARKLINAIKTYSNRHKYENPEGNRLWEVAKMIEEFEKEV
jgi:hypothetical protein